MTSQKGSVHVIIIIGLVALLLGSLGFIFWQNFIQNSGNSKTGKNVSIERIEESTATVPKQTDTVDETDYSFSAVNGFKSSPTQMFEYTASLKAQTTYVNDAGDYFEVLTPFGGGGGINADYFWSYEFDGSRLSINESERCVGEGIGCLNNNGTVEGIISDKTSNTKYYLAFGNKTKNDTDLTFVNEFASTFKFK